MVAVAGPFLTGESARTKAFSWSRAQSLLAGLYSLIAAICVEQAVPTDIGGGPGTVDARIVLVDYHGRRPAEPGYQPAIETNNTVVVGLATFACTYHPWNLILHVNSEAGLGLQSSFLEHAKGGQSVLQSRLVAVDGGISLSTRQAESAGGSETARGYQTVCLGGTFDHVHPGHKLLLTAAALLLEVPTAGSSLSCRFVIGITGDELLRDKKYAEYVQSWDERAGAVMDFLGSLLELREEGWRDAPAGRPSTTITRRAPGDLEAAFRGGTVKVQCVEIQDPFGPTITDESVQSLVVSGETRSGGKAVNDKRKGLGWSELDVFEVDVLDARGLMADDGDQGTDGGNDEDFTSKISSTAIRRQRAEAEGRAV